MSKNVNNDLDVSKDPPINNEPNYSLVRLKLARLVIK